MLSVLPDEYLPMAYDSFGRVKSKVQINYFVTYDVMSLQSLNHPALQVGLVTS